MTGYTVADVANHPNRSQANRSIAGNPKPAEILRAREGAGLTQQQAAELLHTSWRTWQNWEADGPENRRMPPAAWELFNIKLAARKLVDAGELTPAQLRRLGVHLPLE